MDVFVCNEGDEIFPVQSATYRILKKLLPEVEIGKDDVFVDIGCGLGRLMGYLFLNGKRGKKNYGVDINSNAAEFARQVFANDPDVTILCEDATKVRIDGGTVFLMYNPFGEGVLNDFLDHLEEMADPGCRVYYLHAVFEKAFKERGDRWSCLKRVELKPKYHVPVVLCEYKFIGRDQNEVSA